VILVALNIYLGSRAKRLPWAEAEHAI